MSGDRGRLTIPPELDAEMTPGVRAFVEMLLRRIEALEARVADLEAELAATKKTPQNSSLPPSTQHPHAKPPAKKPKSKRHRGGQPGHPKHQRALIPVEDCAAVVLCVPKECRRCGKELSGSDPEPLRHQVWEVPPIEPLVTEYQLHRRPCSCGASTCGQLPPGVPTGQAGPRLIALAALLMGCFRQSKRRVALFLEQVLQQPCSPGWVVKLQNQATDALRPAYEELAEQLPTQDVLAIDETPHKEGAAKSWLWGFVAGTFSVFALRLTRSADALRELLGEDFGGVVHCDRARMYLHLGRLQWCWAHLKRDFQALIDSPDHQAKRLGHDLMRPTREMFRVWARYRDGTISRAEFQRRMSPIRREVEALLLRGAFSGNDRLVGMCGQLHDHREWLWMFVDVEGVEPTNNAAERALRHGVIWRKLSFGTQSAAGSRFVETLLTVIETCRQQRKNPFAFITQAIQARSTGQPAPSLAAEV